MATRGRKPKPTALKILEGTRRDRVNEREPSAPPGRPEIPEHLDGLARAEWERLVPILEGMGVLSTAEGPALALYCEAYSKWLRARSDIAKRGMLLEVSRTVTTKRGATVETTGRVSPNPAVGIELQMARLMKELLVEFGLTPSSRSRIRGEDAGSKDALAEFLKRRSI